MTALKFDKRDNKPPLHQLRPEHIEGMCRVFQWAEDNKYPPQENGQPNYLLGLTKKQYLAAAMRHILAAIVGEDRDPESDELHIDHAMCCLAMMNSNLKDGVLG